MLKKYIRHIAVNAARDEAEEIIDNALQEIHDTADATRQRIQEHIDHEVHKKVIRAMTNGVDSLYND